MNAACLRLLQPVRVLPFLLPVSAAIAQTDPVALQWLKRIHTATQTLSYSGTFVYHQGQQVETTRITHVVEPTGPRERLEALDGGPREILPTRDQTVCYLPASMTVKIEKQQGQPAFPAILSDQIKELSDNYGITRGEVERVGGYNCQTIRLEPKDSMRYGHQLWADVNSGMLLKAKTFNEKHEVVEQFAFTQLQIGGAIARDSLKPKFSRASRTWRVEDSGATSANLAEAGWSLRVKPPGFRTVTELVRKLGGNSGVGHMVLSDGLAAVSVFIEPASVRPVSSQTGLMRQGATNVYVRSVGNHWVTVVGEAPAESVKYIADAVEYRK